MREDSTTRARAIADLIVAARLSGDDIGDSVSLALGYAANDLGSIEAVVAVRPGSWEAELIRRLAMPYATTPDGVDSVLRVVPPT